MKERGIVMAGSSVVAILNGRKTQTRRVMTDVLCPWFNPWDCDNWQPEVNGWAYKGNTTTKNAKINYPYGVPGDRLWVRETFWTDLYINDGGVPKIYYAADGNCPRGDYVVKKKSSRFMPRWASRITLELTAVRVERVQDISRADAIAEGVCDAEWLEWRENAQSVGLPEGSRIPDDIDEYAGLWNKLNFKRGYGWEVNPWVWVLEFKRVTP